MRVPSTRSLLATPVTEIRVTASAGSYDLLVGGAACGAGVFTDLVASCSPPPEGGFVALEMSVDVTQATIGEGETRASAGGPFVSSVGATVEVATSASNTVLISGAVNFRRSDGRLFRFILLPFDLS